MSIKLSTYWKTNVKLIIMMANMYMVLCCVLYNYYSKTRNRIKRQRGVGRERRKQISPKEFYFLKESTQALEYKRG